MSESVGVVFFGCHWTPKREQRSPSQQTNQARSIQDTAIPSTSEDMDFPQPPGSDGVDSLKKLAGDHFVPALSVEKWHEQLRLGQRILCDHNKEKMMSFFAVNFSKLKKAAEVISSKDLEAILQREDLNATTHWLLGFLESCTAFQNLADHEKSRLTDRVISVHRKPPRLLLVLTLYGYSFEAYNCLNNTWYMTSELVNLPREHYVDNLEMVDNHLYALCRGRGEIYSCDLTPPASLVLCLDLGCLEMGWTEVAPMLTYHLHFATTSFQSRCNLFRSLSQ